MFLSAGTDLKIHSSGEEGVETLQIPHPPSSSRIIGISVCNDNSYVALLRENEKPQIFSAKDRNNVRLIHTINVGNIAALAFKHATKKVIAMGTRSGDVVMYDTKSRNVANTYQKITGSIQALEFSCEDQQLCGFDGQTFFVFPDINNNKHLNRYKQSCQCTFLKCHAFINSRVALGLSNGHIGVWDIESGLELVYIEALTSPVSGICMSSCGNYLIASGKQLKICGLDLSTGTCISVNTLEQDKAVSLDLSPDDRFLACGFEDGTLKLFDVKQQFQELYSSKVHDSPVSLIVFENRAKEPNAHFSSVMKMTSDIEVKEVEDVSFTNANSAATITKGPKSVRLLNQRDDSLEKMKRSAMKMVKTEMDSLESQLQEHCSKFQTFLDKEFETIDQIIKKKWDIFNIGDMNQIIKAIYPEEGKHE